MCYASTADKKNTTFLIKNITVAKSLVKNNDEQDFRIDKIVYSFSFFDTIV